jgi:hypothetical protein
MLKLASSRRLATFCAAFVIGVGSLIGPTDSARAADTELDTVHDARLDVYPVESNAYLKDSSAASVWLIFVLIGVVGLGALFWDPGRKNLE